MLTSADESDYFQELISTIFGVVLAISLVEYSALLVDFKLIVFLALFNIHITVIFSWIGYHRQYAQNKYITGTYLGIIRLFFEVLIVTLYALLFYTSRLIAPGDTTFIYSGIPESGAFETSEAIYFYIGLFGFVYLAYFINDLIVTIQHSPPDNDSFRVHKVANLLASSFHFLLAWYSTWDGSSQYMVRSPFSFILVTTVVVVIYRVYLLTGLPWTSQSFRS